MAIKNYDEGMRRGRSVPIIVLALLLAVVAIAWLLHADHKTPGTQQALADLDQHSLESFKAQFNHSSDNFRVIVLLSPT